MTRFSSCLQAARKHCSHWYYFPWSTHSLFTVFILGLLACSLAICELIIHLQLAHGSMLFTAVMLSTTFADVNEILVRHRNPMVYLMANPGLHYFEMVKLFPHRLEPALSMVRSGSGLAKFCRPQT